MSEHPSVEAVERGRLPEGANPFKCLPYIRDVIDTDKVASTTVSTRPCSPRQPPSSPPPSPHSTNAAASPSEFPPSAPPPGAPGGGADPHVVRIRALDD